MDAGAGGGVSRASHTGKGALLAGVSCAALAIACWLTAPASAATYFVGNETELRNAITTANTDGAGPATIVMTQSFAVSSILAMPDPAKPISIATQGFTLSGILDSANGAINFSQSGASDQVTFSGTVRGADGAAGAQTGILASRTAIINNGSIIGGNGGPGAGGTGVQVSLQSSVTNNGTIQGGNSATTNGGAGVDIAGTSGTTSTLTNNGTIRGGNGPTNGTGINGAGVVVGIGVDQIVNSGTIEGGAGAYGITSIGDTASLTIINSGTIRAGTGQATAIQLVPTATTGRIDLELRAGSVIQGNVVANATGLTDVLRLGGSTDASFDVSAIGPAAQYQNFDAFIKTGTSTWTLTGAATAPGPWSVQQGTLLVTGSTLGPMAVLVGATLGGTGTIGGDVTIAANGTLAPGAAGAAPGLLTINGNLTLNNGALLAYNLGQAGVPNGALNDLTNVNGNLTVAGTLNVTAAPGGSFDPGIYRIFNYTGTLTDNGLTVGSVPTPDFSLQTAVAKQVNLVNTAGLTLNFWDGPGTPGDGVISGSGGTWQGATGNNNWANQSGASNAAYAPGSFAVFQGSTLSVVTVDNSQGPVTASGMQFTGTNYTVQGGDLTLTGTQAVIRVGDGTASGAFTQATIASNLIGSAQLVKSDLGTLALTGTNTYTGGTLISAGRLLLGNGGTSGSIVGDVVNNGNLLFYRSDPVTFGGAISGTGIVTHSGTGSTTLTGVNTYTGGTDLAAGTLIGQATSFGSGRIGNNAALIIDQPTDATFANQILGGGSFTKRGAGNLNLTGASILSGPTTVEAGKLSINGTLLLSPVTVLSGATLAGSGAVGSATIQSGATIAPGNSIGTLNVAGNLVLAPGSLYEVEIAGNGSSDRIAVFATGGALGTATVTGSQIGVTALDPQTSYISGQRYTIITAAGGVSGTVAGAVSRSAFLDLSVEHQPNQVDLVIAVKGSGPGTPPGPGAPPTTPPGSGPTPTPTPPPAIFETVAQTRNQFATAGGLDTLPQIGGTLALYNSLLMLDAASARQAFDALSGEIHASAKSALVDESWLLRSAVNDRLRAAFGAVGAQPMATLNYGFAADLAPSATGPMPRPRSDRFAVWGQGYGYWGRSEGDGNAARLTRSSGGFLIGADAAVFDTLRFGVVAGYTRSTFDVNARLSSGESDNYHLGLYGGGQWGALGLRTGASYTWHDIATRRTVAFTGFSNGLKGDYDAGTAQVFGELGYRVDLGQVALEPFAGLAYVNLHTAGLSETGGAAALTGRSDDISLGYSTLGLRASSTLTLQGMDLTLRGGLAWRHAFGEVTPTATLAFTGGSAFTVAGVPIARDAAVVEAGLDLAISKSAALSLAYTGQLAKDAQDHSFKGMLAVRF
ncbi:putative Outer membrane autotransporter barrel domain protein [Bosea sp. LC85]|uniref:autotransporter domain-containing protein n=1 Tax=Bosea sp. LC85 TaxID=1502851 RepID=UPI0004E2E3B6|nr:autotransporter domain-containing protein [Bosea sp. LC85]KFC64784.1 putative Outer membrane autotransporter barrel domain protein [Bosea sp. LC85]